MRSRFKCCHCNSWVSFSRFMGTAHRNHCPFCLWSKHVDLDRSGDRKSTCQERMKPIGLTFKQEGQDKHGKPRQGELMVIHKCIGCGKISINRIAADDKPKTILRVFKEPQAHQHDLGKNLAKVGIRLLAKEDEEQIRIQLFGKLDKPSIFML